MSNDKLPYAEIRHYLKEQANTGRGMLCVVAAEAKVAEGDLHDIVAGEDISVEIAQALAPLLKE